MSRYEDPETREIAVPDFSRRAQGPRPPREPRRPYRQDGPPPMAHRGQLPPRMPPPASPPPPQSPPPSSGGSGSGGRGRGGKGQAAVRTIGEVFITLGLVVLLFVVYELYVTDLFSAEKQREASADLDKQWSQERTLHSEPIDGKAFARLYVPAFGADWNFTIQQGVDAATLEIGPGHYKDTALPGEPGNVGVAGHRVGKGAPFNDLDLLQSCDAVVVETARSFFVYRVLPMQDEVADWAESKAGEKKCANVAPLDDPAYDDTFGRVIVTPDRGDAVAPVPYRPADALPTASQAALLTLTTCHPQFSDRERMIIHSVLTNEYTKQQGANYQDLLNKIGEA